MISWEFSAVKVRGGACRVRLFSRIEEQLVLSTAQPTFMIGTSSASVSVRAESPTAWDGVVFGGMMGRLEYCAPLVLVRCSLEALRRFVWSCSSSRERVPAAARTRSLPFSGDRSVRTVRETRIRLREFSSTRAEARPSISRNLDASAEGVAATSFCEWLWTCPRARERTVSAERVREGRKGSDEEVAVAVVEDDGPAADVGSSKSNVSGFGAGVDCSLIGRKKKDQHEDRTHDDEVLTMRLLIPPSQHRLTGSFAT